MMNSARREPSDVMKEIVEATNMEEAIRKVKANRGKPGPDKMTVFELEYYFDEHGDEVVRGLLTGEYKPQPVRRVYIPKANGKQRPLGIPNVIDRVVQQATAQIMEPYFEEVFHDNSFGFRKGKSAQQAVLLAAEYLNEGYEWVVDLDIEKFFDKVNHDKLISNIREVMPQGDLLSLIRKFLTAGVMENGVKVSSLQGTPQGGNISPLLANIYLNKLDWELNSRGLHFVRYADDCVIFAKSELAANRIMNSISSWIERKLFLKVSPTKTKVVGPRNSKFLGFSFGTQKGKWVPVPHTDSKKSLKRKIKKVLCRRKAAAQPLNDIFFKLGQVLRGWINYYCIGFCKSFMREIGKWMRHKVRVVMLKHWKRRYTIYRNLCKIYDNWGKMQQLFWNKAHKRLPKLAFDKEYIFAQCYTKCGWFRLGYNQVVNTLIHPWFMESTKTYKNSDGDIKRRYALVNPLDYYCSKHNVIVNV